MNQYDIILRPVLSEKSTFLREGEKKQYTFEVSKRATKIDILRAVEAIYSVAPESCRIINVRGKKKSNRPISRKNFRRGHGTTRSWKKAIVSLPKGERIERFEGV